MILLDTDIMVDLLRGYPPAVSWLESINVRHLAAVPDLRTVQPYPKAESKR
jgi:hypothetical protein